MALLVATVPLTFLPSFAEAFPLFFPPLVVQRVDLVEVLIELLLCW